MSATILNTGLVLQKQAVSDLERLIKQPSLAGAWKARNWFAGTLLTLVAYVFFFLAVEILPTLTVQSIMVSGVLVVVIISIVFLKEHLERMELLGLLLIVTGVLLLGMFPQTVVEEIIDWNWLLVLLVAGLACFAALPCYNRFVLGREWLKNGGLLAGLCAGASTVFSKILVMQAEPLLPYLGNVFFYLVVLMQVLSMVLLQLTFKVNKAVVAIPAYHSSSVVVPLVSGPLVFSEIFTGWQLVAVVVIITGTFLLARLGSSVYETPEI